MSCARLVKVPAFVCLLFCAGSLFPVFATKPPARLRNWVGRNPGFRAKRGFFNDKWVRTHLAELLNKSDFIKLTRRYYAQAPVREEGGFLIISQCKTKQEWCCPCENSSLIISLADGAIHVAFNESDREQTRWVSSNGKYKDLPFEVSKGGLILEGQKGARYIRPDSRYEAISFFDQALGNCTVCVADRGSTSWFIQHGRSNFTSNI
ncbi:MAG TPA: hypothetical protein VFD58_28550 [Blastocatellia bacterium]|nr:hypothetical protein [Blastocatellia bacterium]